MLRWQKRFVQKGLTLSEVLIALAILGVVSAFVLPKMITSVGINMRYNRAVAIQGDLLKLMEDYRVDVLDGAPCFPGFLCEPSGGMTYDTADPTSPVYSELASYIDGHLSYLRKETEPLTLQRVWYLPSKDTLALREMWAYEGTNPQSGFQQIAVFVLALNRTPEQGFSGDCSMNGVDTHIAELYYFPKKAVVLGGENAFMHSVYLNDFSYDSVSVFDQKAHPEAVCSQISTLTAGAYQGSNCHRVGEGGYW